MTPAAVMALALGAWCLSAGMGWTSSFCIDSGPLSHWQAWIAAAVVLQLGAHYLGRLGKPEDTTAS